MPPKVLSIGTEDVLDLTPVLDTSIYADGDVLFVATEIANFFTELGGKRALHSIIVSDGDDQNVAFDLVFSNASITLGTINAAVSISDADAAKIIGVVSFATTDAVDLINSRLFHKESIGLVLESAGVTTSVWVAGISRGGTPTYTASGFKIKIGVL